MEIKEGKFNACEVKTTAGELMSIMHTLDDIEPLTPVQHDVHIALHRFFEPMR